MLDEKFFPLRSVLNSDFSIRNFYIDHPLWFDNPKTLLQHGNGIQDMLKDFVECDDVESALNGVFEKIRMDGFYTDVFGAVTDEANVRVQSCADKPSCLHALEEYAQA